MSAAGIIFEITPLLPWRPASLSPTTTFRIWATLTNILERAPCSSSSPLSRERILTSITVPFSPCGIRREVSLTSLAFSPKIARSSLSSAVSSVSPLGAILPTKISFGPTSAPTTTIPFSSRFAKSSSETLGISRVVSSGPSLVSTTDVSYSSMCIEVKTSSLNSLSDITIESS